MKKEIFEGVGIGYTVRGRFSDQNQISRNDVVTV